MLHAKEQERDPMRRARDPDLPLERAVEIGGVAYVMAATATEMLATDTGLKPTQAAFRLRQLARRGRVRAVKLAPKLTVYAELDLLDARRELLTKPERG